MASVSGSTASRRSPARSGSAMGIHADPDQMGYFVTVSGGPTKKIERRKSLINITTAYLKRLDSTHNAKEVADSDSGTQASTNESSRNKLRRPNHLYRSPRRTGSTAQALAPHEHLLAQSLQLEPDMNVLSLGCGCGGPAKNIARFANCNIVGVSNNQEQVTRAQSIASRNGGTGAVSIRFGNYLDLPFSDNAFDSIYAIEGSLQQPSLTALYDEVYRVLKPGALFCIYEWVLTDSFLPEDPLHQTLRHAIEKGNSLSNLQSRSAALGAFKSAGFTVIREEDLATPDDPAPWWRTVSGDVEHAKDLRDWMRVARMTVAGKVAVRSARRGMEALGVTPKGSAQTAIARAENRELMVRAGKIGIFSPMYLMVGRKEY